MNILVNKGHCVQNSLTVKKSACCLLYYWVRKENGKEYVKLNLYIIFGLVRKQYIYVF